MLPGMAKINLPVLEVLKQGWNYCQEGHLGEKIISDLDIPENMWNKAFPGNPCMKSIMSHVDLADVTCVTPHVIFSPI